MYGEEQQVPEVVVVDENGEQVEVPQEEQEAIRSTRFNSSNLCFIEGGVTGEAAASQVFKRRDDARKAAEEKARKSAETELSVQQRREEAAGSADMVKRIVREKGWATGGRGQLTGVLMKAALLELDKSSSSAKNNTDLIALVKAALLWKEELGCFAADAPAEPAQPPPPPVQPE